VKVLVIEDSKPSAEVLGTTLQREGIDTYLVVKDSYVLAAEEACSVLRKVHHEDQVFEALVLDIDFKDHQFGGVRIFIEIQRQFLRDRFKHLIIWTRHKSASRLGSSIEADVVDVIRDLSGMSQQSVFGKGSTEAQKIVEYLRELANQRTIIVSDFRYWAYGRPSGHDVEFTVLATEAIRKMRDVLLKALVRTKKTASINPKPDLRDLPGWRRWLDMLETELQDRGES
jgi:CheY-like chemotaxis protein